MDDAEIDMYTRVFAREFRYKYRFPLYDKEGNEVKQEQDTEDKDKQDYGLVGSTIDDMFNQYSY